MGKAMALLVAFSGARMDQFAALQRKDIIDSAVKITVNTLIKKGEDLVGLRQEEGVGENWMQQRTQENPGLSGGGWVLRRFHVETCNDDEAERGRSFAGRGE
ncbi:MAG: hypothetical protein EZS28_032082 [Streblomastix strix]|uniref:Uncharacterized protein n=1 Tax=Streblomastix strix TaxID=222440 RepID=A0A5J4UQG0_9EUKA|nr:MAG: hypothetical protein EZS28_032082 [Streblomastix strix]